MQINRYRAINETEKVTIFMCDSLSMCYEQLIKKHTFIVSSLMGLLFSLKFVYNPFNILMELHKSIKR